MTGSPRGFARRMMSFWIAGTSSGGISTPRSPRATITPSVFSRIASSRAIASGFSSLAMIGTCRPASAIAARAWSMSPGCRTKESAM